jgi:hypothetical protein
LNGRTATAAGKADKMLEIEIEIVNKDRAALLADLKKQCPGGQIPAKELYAPDPVAKSMQGPLEVAVATFPKIKR